MKTFDQLYQAALSEKYPSFEVPKNLYPLFQDTFRFCSPLTMGLSGSELSKLYDKIIGHEKLSYYDFACVSNALEARTPAELVLPMNIYLPIMVQLEELSKIFNEETVSMREKIIQQLAKDKITAPKDKLSGNTIMSAVK